METIAKKSKVNQLVIVRGAGDLATGVIQKLARVGFRVLVLEIDQPLAVRRTVSLCNAVYQGEMVVENMHAVKIHSVDECDEVWTNGQIPILCDPYGVSIDQLHPLAVVDAILAKKNLGTNQQMAPITIALGPGFEAGKDVDIVIETMRGHQLGRLYFEGTAIPNTGVPGEIGGKSRERVIHAPCSGRVTHFKQIGDTIEKGDILFFIDELAVEAPIGGILRGLIAENIYVEQGVKSADIDPRPLIVADCFTISDKARALGGAVLEALLLKMDKKAKKYFFLLKNIVN